jgi:pimeloyl-ACP methyl ester carboxylesterase
MLAHVQLTSPTPFGDGDLSGGILMTTTDITRKIVEREHDTTLHYTISGPADGQTVVFIHGWTCSQSDFDQLNTHLPADWRKVTLALAEHGESRSTRSSWTMADFADDVAAVLDAESIDRATVVGHSMGGAVALELARRRPGTVDHIIGLDTFHYLSLYPQVDEAGIRSLMNAFDADFLGTVRSFVVMGSVADSDADFDETIFQRLSNMRQPAGLHAIEEVLRWDFDEALRDVDVKIDVLAVRELMDPDALPRYGDRIDFIPVELGGHYFFMERPQETADLLIDLVRNASSQSAGTKQ